MNVTRTILSSLMLLAGCGSYNVRNSAAKLQAKALPIKGAANWTAGSGVLVTLPSGFTGLLTNAHVCDAIAKHGLQPYTIIGDKATEPLILVKIGDVPDLCLYINISILKSKGMKVKNTSTLDFAEQLMVLGYPNNNPLSPQVGYYIGQGMMSFLTESDNGICSGEVFVSFLGIYCIKKELLNSMTTLIYGGNSGSPVFNTHDELVGLVNSADPRTAQGYFVPGNQITQFLKGF